MHVDAETEAQIHDLIDLRTEHRKRLHALERQAAQQGMQTPAHITTEIEHIKEQLAGIEATITKLYVAEARHLARNVWEPGEAAGDHTPERLRAIWRELGNIETAVHREAGGIYHLVETHYEQDSRHRRQRQTRNDVYSISVIVLLILLIFIVLFR